jgi:hypothetical protein
MASSGPGLIALTILVAGAAVAALIATVVIYLVQTGARRAGLAPLAAGLSMVGPLVGVAAASKHLAETFAEMASSGGGAAALIAGCAQAERLMSIGNVGAVITAVVAAGLGWVCAAESKLVRSTVRQRRTGTLLGLTILPVLAVASLHEYARTTNRIAVAVAEAPTAKPGEPGEGPVVVQALISRMSRGVWLGAIGAPALLVLVIAAAIVATVLGWSAAVPESFRILGTFVFLAIAALAVTGIVLFQRPVVLPR